MNALTAPNRRLFAASAGALIAGVTLASSAEAAGRAQPLGRSATLIRRLYDAVNKKDEQTWVKSRERQGCRARTFVRRKRTEQRLGARPTSCPDQLRKTFRYSL